MTDLELDALVAEKVFGLRGNDFDPSWAYSTTGDGMLAVIEKMRERGFRFEAGTVAIGKDNALYLVGFGKGHGFAGHQAEGLPRAVAIAALRALVPGFAT